MRKELSLQTKPRREIEQLLFEAASKSYAKAHDGKVDNKYIGELVRMFMDNPLEMRHADPLMESLYKTYLKIAYTAVSPTLGRTYRNNKIVDMTYSVLTNETTTDKMMNPGGFDLLKRVGYMVEALRLNPNIPWSVLLSKTISELKDLCYTEKNLSFIDTHVQFYKLNSAAGTILGMFAVLKVAHAVLESNGLFVDIDEACKFTKEPLVDEQGNPITDVYGQSFRSKGFTIAGKTFNGRMELDSKLDDRGQLIGKTLGSLVASAADAVKDPVLNLMNINSQTANILNTLIRLGMPFDNAALFLSLKAITDALADYNSRNITSFTRLSDVILEKIDALDKEFGFSSPENNINAEEFTLEELVKGLTSDSPLLLYKALKMFLHLNSIALAIKGATFATRFNSISAAVGPLVIDNLIMEHKMDNFSMDNSCIYDSFRDNANKVDMEEVLSRHPIINSFAESVDIAKTLFKDMPANSIGFRNVLGALSKVGGKALTDMIYNDRKLLSLLSDFYLAYLLVADDAISNILLLYNINSKYGNLNYFINQFPADFLKGNAKEKYSDNALILAIKLDATEEGRPILKVDITGLDTQLKERLSNAWVDLHKDNPKLSTLLFLYNFYRTGVAFSPKTFMSLVPTYVKESLTAYVDTYRKFPLTSPETVIDLFIRNNWGNNKLVPKVNARDISIENGLLLGRTKEAIARMLNMPYCKIKIDGADRLYQQSFVEETVGGDVAIFTEITPLGNNGEYLEISKNDITTPLAKPTKAIETTPVTELRDLAPSEVTNEPSELDIRKQHEREIKELLVSVFLTIKYPTRELAIEKIKEFKAKDTQAKKSLEKAMKLFIEARLKTLGVEYNAEKIDELYLTLC